MIFAIFLPLACVLINIFPLSLAQSNCDTPLIQPAVLPALPYPTDGLEPVISKSIVELHYKKHHQAYVDNLNIALLTLVQVAKAGNISNLVALQKAIKFNTGGFLNHNLYWENLTPLNNSTKNILKNNSVLMKALNDTWGNFTKFQSEFTVVGSSLQGSGWVWLGWNPMNKSVLILTTANQDPLDVHNLKPLLGIDLWEHAYYLDYQNQRSKYMDEIWKIVNWEVVESRYLNLMNITKNDTNTTLNSFGYSTLAWISILLPFLSFLIL